VSDEADPASTADVRDYDTVHRHILDTADTLSAGIMRQFPQRFG
jgi:hypothetical protein